MTAVSRPVSTLDWGGTAVEPSGGQKTTGFAPDDRPPAQWFNYFLQNLDGWIKYLDDSQGAQRRAFDALLDWRDGGASSGLSGADLSAIAYGAGILVGVGQTGLLATSTDGGLTWTVRTPGSAFASNFNDVTFNSALNLWIAVGDDGEVQTAPAAGTPWTRRHTSATDHLYSIATNGSTLNVAVGVVSLTSTNGTAWSAGGALPGRAFHVAYSSVAGHFVAGGDSGVVTTSLFQSTNGASWTAINVSLQYIETIAVDAVTGVFVVDGRETFAGTNRRLLSSTNGTSFTLRVSYTGTAGDGYSALATGAGFVHRAYNVAGNVVRRSLDGAIWVTDCRAVMAFVNSRAPRVISMDGARIALATYGAGTPGLYRSRIWTVPV